MRRLVHVLVPCVILLLAACSSGTSTSKAEQETERAERPMRALALLRQGSVFLQQGRYQDALGLFEEADATAPRNATTYNMIGLCHLRLQAFDQSLVYFNKALEVIPSFTDARNNRGMTYLAMGQYRMAEVDFSSVLADTTYPHHWSVYYNLGMANVGQNRLGAAEENFLRAATAQSPIFEANFRLAEVYQEQGRVDEAIEVLENTALNYPERPQASLAAGRLLAQLDRHEEARPHLERVIANYPGTAFAEEAKSYLGND